MLYLIRKSATALALLSLFLMAACGDGIKAAEVESLELTPSAASIAAGTTQQFAGVAILSDGTNENLVMGATWSSSNSSVATVNQSGLASGVSPGTATISLSAGELSITATLTVTDALLESIALTPTNPSIAAGTDQALIATGSFSDGTTQDLSTEVTWSSSNTDVATVSSMGLATSSAAGSADITATSGAVSGSTTLTVTAATLVSISVEPASPGIANGTTQQLSATGVFSDASTQDLSATVTWTSSETGVATIDSAGLATGVSEGSSTITATSGAVSGSTSLTVTAAVLASLDITPANPTIADGTNQQFTATGTFTDATTQDLSTEVTWSSSNTGIATISNADNSEGLATAVLAGTAVITATSGAISATTNLNVTDASLVSIAVTPVDPSTALGINRQFTATGTFSDATTQDVTTSVTWSSSNTDVAEVSNAFGSRGLATPVALGTATITATDPNNAAVAGSSDLTVTAAILQSLVVTPESSSVAAGTDQAFVATGLFSDGSSSDLTTSVTWTSSNDATATIGVNTGIATGQVTGAVTITAASGAVSDTATLTVTAATLVSIQVTPTNPSIPLGNTQAFVATGLFTNDSVQDISEQVTWTSSVSGVATISNAAGSRGLATSVTTGSTNITATDPVSGTISDSTGLEVTDAVLESISITGVTSLPEGTSTQLTATGIFTDGSSLNITATATWSDGDASSVVSVSNAADRGTATAIAAGTSSVTATRDGVSETVAFTTTDETLVSITVAPATPSIAAGTSQQFTATGNYSGGSSVDIGNQVTWTSSAAAASVNQQGLATGEDVGSANIIATIGDISGSTTLTVTAAVLAEIVVAPASVAIPLGNTQQFTATGIFTDGSTQVLTDSVTWISLTPGTATVSNAAGEQGLATSVAVGSTEIVATDASTGLSDSSVLTVNDAALVSIAVTPIDPSVAAAANSPVPFTATGTFTDNTTPDITTQVTWTSSDTTVATIDADTGVAATNLNGVIGDTVIRATSGTIFGESTLTVTAATLESIEVTSTNASVARGTEEQFTATGIFSDLRTQDLTDSATWSCVDEVVDTNVAAIDAAGLATADNVGSCTATATSGTVSGTTSFTVTAAELVSITVTPGTVTRALGLTATFNAAGTFTDGTIQNPLSNVLWNSDADAVASIDPNGGVATTLSVGTANITASRDGISSADAVLTVSEAALVSIAVTSDDPDNSIADGTTSQLTANGTFTDDSVVDLTEQVSWSCVTQSGVDPILTISNVEESRGFATAQDVGSCTATASLSDVQGTLGFTVTDATLVSIVIAEDEPLSTPLGRSLQLNAIGTFTDASIQNVTSRVNWASSDGNIAFVLNGDLNRGVGVPVALGTVVVTATFIDDITITDTADFTVTEAELVSLEITPAEPTISVTQVIPLTATGTYTDGSTVDHTDVATTDWLSSDENAASVGNSDGNRGVTVGVADGFAIISATDIDTGISDSTCVAVGTGVCPPG